MTRAPAASDPDPDEMQAFLDQYYTVARKAAGTNSVGWLEWFA
ncbi:MAG: hypothetical protein ACN4GZ_18145 [Acidimicrobiales bacterium]